MTENKSSKNLWNTTQNDLAFYIPAFIATILFLLRFSFSTSPFTCYVYGDDSAFFMEVGMGMTKGLLPYRDFFDMKGPFLFLIQYLGQLLSYGRNGIFILQIINLFITIILADKCLKMILQRAPVVLRLFHIGVIFYILAITFEGGNFTEEFSLPFLYLSTLLLLKYLYSKPVENHPVKYAFYYGVMFCLLAFIRVTNAVLICACVFTVTIILLVQKRYKNLFHNALGFLLGLIAASLPFFVFFAYHGILKDMLFSVFEFGILYSKHGASRPYQMAAAFLLLLPLGLWTAKVRDWKIWLFGMSALLGTAFILKVGNNYLHYYQLIVPIVTVGISYLLYGIKADNQLRLSVVSFVLVLGVAVGMNARIFAQAVLANIKNEDNNYNYAMQLKASIPENERDSVYAFFPASRWYVMTGIMPYNKYCDWQENYMAMLPSIRDEIYHMFLEAPPKHVVIAQEFPVGDSFIQNTINSSYQKIVSNEHYALFSYRNDLKN